MTLSRRRLLTQGAAAALLTTPFLSRPARAQTTLTVASLFGEDKPETKIWLRIRDLVEVRLPGRFNFNIVQNAALGGEKEVAEGAQLGSVQASLSTVSVLTGWVPELQILDLPFLFRDRAHVAATVAGEVGSDLSARLAEKGFAVPAFINYGARHILTKTPVTQPGELAGKRIRVIQSPLHTTLWSAFGATPIGIPITETYNALATGAADAMDLTKSAYAGFRLFEVVPYLTETGHIWASGAVYFAKPFWDGLSDEEREVLSSAAGEGARHFNDLIVADEEASVATAEAAGAQVVQPQDIEAWRAGATAVWDSLADVVGGRERIEAVRAIAS